MGKVHKSSAYNGIFDSLKGKLVEIAVDYFKKNAEATKRDILKYVEKTIENKIKKELRKYVYSVIGLILVGFGALFLLFGLFSVIINLLGLPDYVTILAFGLFSVLVGLIVYLMR